jgi:hypothetical protein
MVESLVNCRRDLDWPVDAQVFRRSVARTNVILTQRHTVSIVNRVTKWIQCPKSISNAPPVFCRVMSRGGPARHSTGTWHQRISAVRDRKLQCRGLRRGVMHLPEPETAQREMRGGRRFAISVWEGATPNTGFGLICDAVRAPCSPHKAAGETPRFPATSNTRYQAWSMSLLVSTSRARRLSAVALTRGSGFSQARSN